MESSGGDQASKKTVGGGGAAKKQGKTDLNGSVGSTSTAGGRAASPEHSSGTTTSTTRTDPSHGNIPRIMSPVAGRKKNDMMDIVAAAAAAAAQVDDSAGGGGGPAPDSTLGAKKPPMHAAAAAAAAAKKNSMMDIVAAASAAAAQASESSGIGSETGGKTGSSSSILHNTSHDSSTSSGAKKGHNRKISWGGVVDVLKDEKKSSIRIPDLNQVNPLEQEAETHIISTLEDLEAKDKSRGEKKPEILEFVPQGAEGVFLDEAQQQQQQQQQQHSRRRSMTGSTASGRQASAGDGSVGQNSTQSRRGGVHVHRPVHQRVKTTVEQDLFSLTNALEAMNHPDHLPPGVDSALPPAPKQHQQTNNPQHAVGSADLLAANAAILFRRNRAKISVDADGQVVPDSHATGEIPGSVHLDGAASGGGGGDDGGAAAPTAASRWNKLRAAGMAVGGHAVNLHHKKTDSDQPVGSVGSGVTSSNVYNGPVDLDDDMEVDDLEIGLVDTHPMGDDSPTNSDGKSKLDAEGGGGMRRMPMLAFLRGRTVLVKDFVRQERYGLFGFFLIMSILIAVACILFYVFDNPPTGVITIVKDEEGNIISQDPIIIDPSQASHSWWILFAVRLMVTFGLAVVSEFFVIDIFCLRWRWINVFRSNLLTLLFVQSRGWPFRAVAWSIYNFLMLNGADPFACHWLYYQDAMRVFNDSNPCGDKTSYKFYTQVLFLMLFIGLVTSFKRVWVGFMQGKRVFSAYGEEVAALMRKVLLISQVGMLARDIEMKHLMARYNNVDTRSREDGIWEKVEHFVHDNDETGKGLDEGVLDPGDRNNLTGSFSQSQQMKIVELLGDWEDPQAEMGTGGIDRNVSVASILQFRQSLAFFDISDMFGYYFGPTDTRAHCIESAEEVYERLLLRSSHEDTLSFHVLAMLALHSDGTLKQDKIKELISMFRPDRDGTLSALDFVKSVDDVYKKMKLLNATIQKTQRLDQAVEKIFNIGFYIVLGSIALSIVGIDPMALFLSLSSIIVAFAFMIGSASAKYFEGLLFILVRKPYGVGDRVFVNAPENETSSNGSAGWFVRDITLYHTTLVFGTTNEYCTVSNGSLANLRVINAARSPKAVLYVYLKFGVQVPWSKIQVFENSLRSFVKSRPREWLGVNGFRTTRVESDLGFQEIVVVLQHRESWQNIVALLVSKAEVTAFCHELQKKMDMKYISPPMPIELTMSPTSANPLPAVNDQDVGQSVVAKLDGLAKGMSLEETGASPADFEAVAKLFGKESDE